MNLPASSNSTNMADQMGRAKIVLVLTRGIPIAPKSGRERTLSFIQRALVERYDVTTTNISSIVDKPNFRRVVEACATLLHGFASIHPCPLQVAIFRDARGLTSFLVQLAKLRPDAVYFDSVRTVDWLVATRRQFPEMRLICDFDDLMSVRFEALLRRHLPISLGYFGNRIPRWVRNFLRCNLITRAVLRYEAWSLRNSERVAISAANAVTVVSAIDAEKFGKSVRAPLSNRIRVVAPAVSFPNPFIRTRECQEFIFVGSDTLLQNRLSIEFLVDLWLKALPSTRLRIIGEVVGTYPSCRGVTFSGFIDDINDVYSDVCIALCPSFVEGGIKTKVLEALGQGVIPVGNTLTFAGMGCDPGLLAMKSEDFLSFVCTPEAWIGRLRDSAIKLRECAYGRYSFDAVAEEWSQVVSGSDSQVIQS